jgi:hypothetical protein
LVFATAAGSSYIDKEGELEHAALQVSSRAVDDDLSSDPELLVSGKADRVHVVVVLRSTHAYTTN